MSALVSICIPAYNNGPFIEETLRCVLGQTFENLEVVIVDDCSTDDTVERIRKFNDPRIRFEANSKNLGMHDNWSKTLALSRGDYIKIVCGDDLIMPDCVEKQVRELSLPENADVAMVVCRRRIIGPSGRTAGGSFYKLRPGKYSGEKVLRACVTAGTNLIGEPMAVLMDGATIRKYNVTPGSNNYMIDFDIYTKVLSHGKLRMMKEELAAFRIHDTSMTRTLGMKHARMFVEFIRQPWLRKEFHIRWYHLLVGTLITYPLSLVRNLVIRSVK
jgi:glycosyltransferase involved in cell wall biosynthesis